MLQEDWSKESVQLVASISVQDVNDISVDKTLPLYCTLVRPMSYIIDNIGMIIRPMDVLYNTGLSITNVSNTPIVRPLE